MQLLPDRPAGYNFKLHCIQHDICYGTWAWAATKDSCDARFYSDLQGECTIYTDAPLDASLCRSLADLYYDALDGQIALRSYAQCSHAPNWILAQRDDWAIFCAYR